MRVSTVISLLSVLALLASPLVAQSTQWSFCGVIQSQNFYSIVSAVLTTNQSTSLTYRGTPGAFYVTSSIVGQRQFYNLSQGSTPVLQQTAVITSLDPPGSTGGNTNYFWPSNTPSLDGDGLTFRLSSIPIVDGHNDNPAATTTLNYWFDKSNNNYDEENAGSTHETAAWASSLSIVSSSSATLPTCAPRATVQFSYCLVMVGPTYNVVFNGIVTTNGLAKPYAASSSNQLPGTQQGVVASAATGQRVFTNLTTGSTSTTNVVSLAPAGTFIGNGNKLYPGYSIATDWDGIAFNMDGPVLIAGQANHGNQVVFWREAADNAYLEETASNRHELAPSYTSFSLQPYVAGSAIPACSVPQVAGNDVYYSFCSQLIGTNFTVILTGMLTVQNIPLTSTSGQLRYLVKAASGERIYTDLLTGVKTTNYITSLAPLNTLGGNTNYLYSVSPYLDGDGLTFIFDSVPPINSRPTGANPYLNFWADSTTGTYLEETSGGSHEATPATSMLTIQSATTGAAAPTCYIPESADAGLTRWSMCATLQSATFTSSLAAVLTTSATQTVYNGKAAYSVVSATGSRTFTNLTTSSMAQQTVYITQLDPPGSTGGNTNYIFPTLNPLLDGDGLTFRLNTIPLIDGQTGFAGATPTLNFWYTSGTYLEENAGGRHETTPFASSLVLSPYSPNSGTGPQCSIPTSITFQFCFMMIAPTYTTLFSGTLVTSGLAKPIAPNSSNQLKSTQQGYVATSATGTRTFTNLTSGAVSTSTVISLAPASSFIGNSNLVFPGYSVATDWNGIAFQMNGPVAIAGEPAGGNTFVLWYQKAESQYLEETQQAMHETTPTTSSFVLWTSTSAATPSCALPVNTATTIYYSFCTVIGNVNFSAVTSGVLALNAVPVTVGGKTAYIVTASNGTRTFTNFQTGVITSNTILSLAPTGTLGGNTNYLYLGSVPLLDGDGITFNFDGVPPIYAEPTGSTQMNMWFDGSDNSYLEETQGGTHEGQPTFNSMTVNTYTGALPTCSAAAYISSTGAASANSESSSSSLSGGAIAGIVIGVVAGCAFLLFAVFIICCGGRKSRTKLNNGDSNESSEMSTRDDDIEMQ